MFVGQQLSDGMKVVIIEDVMTSGKAVKEVYPKVTGEAKVDITGMIITVDRMEKALSLDLEASVLDEQVRLLSQELRTTSQRVNLFEKVKIPEAKANIKKISVYLGDQQVSAVVISKVSKKKIDQRNAAAALAKKAEEGASA
jgi:H(+)-transporting ATP synthase subunit D